MAYLLDTNVFVNAMRHHYGFDFCPAFWEWLIARNAAGAVISIEKVAVELKAIADDLAAWAADRGEGFFQKPGDAVLPALTKISTWVSGQNYAVAAVTDFLSCADYYVIAHALAGGHTVVTHEVPAPASKKKIKIPDVCKGVNVKCATPYQILQAEKARFVLAAAV